MYTMDLCAKIFIGIFQNVLMHVSDEKKKMYKSALFWTEMRRRNDLCLECWIDKLLEDGQQHLLQKVWLPLEYSVHIDSYQWRMYLLREAIHRVFGRDSYITTWSTYFVNGEINIGYLVNKAILYREVEKLKPIEDLLPKSERRRLNKARPKNILGLNRCYVCEDCAYGG